MAIREVTRNGFSFVHADAIQLTGTLSSGGVSYVLNGVLEEGSILGTVTAENMGLYFAAELNGGQFYLTLFEANANNRPNYDAAQTIVFSRTGEGAT